MIELWPLLLVGLAPLIAGVLLNPHGSEWSLRTMVASTLLCALCFCLTFFWQEVWLVIPKALTPGLSPILYHNDHDWSGDNPISELLQGTGAIATLISGLIFLALLMRLRAASATWSLFIFWMAFQGAFQGLTQLLVGTLVRGNDVGRALAYLGIGSAAKFVLFFGAVVAMYFVGRALARLYPVAGAPGDARSRPFAWMIFLPAILSVALIIPFRMPREIVEVLLVPLIVNIIGAAWVIAGAVHVEVRGGGGADAPLNLRVPAIALCLLLAFFQFILRPGLSF